MATLDWAVLMQINRNRWEGKISIESGQERERFTVSSHIRIVRNGERGGID